MVTVYNQYLTGNYPLLDERGVVTLPGMNQSQVR